MGKFTSLKTTTIYEPLKNSTVKAQFTELQPKTPSILIGRSVNFLRSWKLLGKMIEIQRWDGRCAAEIMDESQD